jgi:hypothetical protein
MNRASCLGRPSGRCEIDSWKLLGQLYGLSNIHRGGDRCIRLHQSGIYRSENSGAVQPYPGELICVIAVLDKLISKPEIEQLAAFTISRNEFVDS